MRCSKHSPDWKGAIGQCCWHRPFHRLWQPLEWPVQKVSELLSEGRDSLPICSGGMGSHKALWIHKVWCRTRHPLQFRFPCFSNTASQQSNSHCQFPPSLLCQKDSQGAWSAFQTPLLSAEQCHWSVTSSWENPLPVCPPSKAKRTSPLPPRSPGATDSRLGTGPMALGDLAFLPLARQKEASLPGTCRCQDSSSL